MNAELTISLPQSIKNFIDEQVAKGGYSTPDEYVCDLVREAKEREAEERLEGLLLEALDSGPATPMTKEDWEEIRQRGLARIQNK
ncbi:MAG: type II toxin-antitoxin system ParD family antitoxin [Blastocatellales bacterium]